MKLVKLTSQHKLHRFGYTHAFRFNSYTEGMYQIVKIKDFLTKAYPGTSDWACSSKYPKTEWAIHWPPYNYKSHSRPYWIAVKKEEDVTMCLLVAS